MRVKICGITSVEQGQAIAQLGATALGFICFRRSPRYVAPEQIRVIVAQLPDTAPPIDRVGVFVDASLLEICSVVAIANLNGVQLHGNESPQFCQQLQTALPTVEIIKALRIRDRQELERSSRYHCCVNTLLLDAYQPGLWGGTGKTLDWSSLQKFRPSCPWLLAGGITPDNVQEALNQIHPDGIDLSSGVEVTPGNKDLRKVVRLFEQLQSFEQLQKPGTQEYGCC